MPIARFTSAWFFISQFGIQRFLYRFNVAAAGMASQVVEKADFRHPFAGAFHIFPHAAVSMVAKCGMNMIINHLAVFFVLPPGFQASPLHL